MSLLAVFFILLLLNQNSQSQTIPLAEHPRPDWQRSQWQNLNGPWTFQFDAQDRGLAENWQNSRDGFAQSIQVPFPWGSPLSGVEDKADIGWYQRRVRIPSAWRGQRVFLVIGACDWHTSAWLNGEKLGDHRGGYTPFEFEITNRITYDQDQSLVLRVDDTPHSFKLEGKQGYGPARGIWQTAYLECRGSSALKFLHFIPDIDRDAVTVRGRLLEPAPRPLTLTLSWEEAAAGRSQTVKKIKKGQSELSFTVSLPQPHLWSLDDPYLYEVTATLAGEQAVDTVRTYFGMRKISVTPLPGAAHPYIALNNKPIYLQLALDQAYHEQGYYTYESDAFMRDEILRSKRIGLNGLREHVKIEIPRKLYWADRLGLLIMADVPNSWGAPDAEMKQETEYALTHMLQRDFNHPSIFSWVLFNETWGLTDHKQYTPETQKWVADLFSRVKKLDPSRLIEDNSACNYDHVVTDINSWHAYLPGYRWAETVQSFVDSTFAGSAWNFAPGCYQKNEPLLNSECGNVWGYEGSTGDVDWSWDYHIMLNVFRSQPKVCGWLYTELHDVINEWNGYYRFDRSEKITGLEELVPGMSLCDLHAPLYIAPQIELCVDRQPGEIVSVPLQAGFLSESLEPGAPLSLEWRLVGWDELGRRQQWGQGCQSIRFQTWYTGALEPLSITLPSQRLLSILQLMLKSASGHVLHRNFTCFVVKEKELQRDKTLTTDAGKMRLLTIPPKEFTAACFSSKQWSVLDGLKENGCGNGYFEYRLSWPADLQPDRISEAAFIVEASAKQLFGKDKIDVAKMEGDYMRGKGSHDPSLNRNAYPMTDGTLYPSRVRVRVNGVSVGVFDLPDDPADHRGILSWHSQLHDRFLREAGSYGYLLRAQIPAQVLAKARQAQQLIIRLEVDESLPGGLAIYGRDFGRYPLDPTVVLMLK